MVKLVEGLADRLTVPSGKRDTQVFDDDLPGFGLRKFDSGRASYFVKFNIGPQQRRLTLGAVVRGNLREMRLEASRILAKARLGTDVVALKRVAAAKCAVTVGDLVPKYLESARPSYGRATMPRSNASSSETGSSFTASPLTGSRAKVS
jgi:hypothetical protein